jgi:2-polyprenyl-3-methyl-5-hydroxy-6-metoxy-1,4-benzoquinol methylase
MSIQGKPTEMKCHHCGSIQLKTTADYAGAMRVTSDCKPWRPGGVLAGCQKCGLVQTVTTPQWAAEADEIYTAYTIYHQSGGVEQPTFNAATGVGRSRSDAIVEALSRHVTLPATGRALDFGCGNGAFLRAFSRALPGWALCGSEVSEKYKKVVESIPGVERLYTGAIDSLPGDFDLISLVHVIEHIPSPGDFLRALAAKLKPGGLLFIEVPNCEANPFILMVADHCSHFSTGSLTRIAADAGFTVLEATSKWVPKEISLVARWTPDMVVVQSISDTLEQEQGQVLAGWDFLQSVATQASSLSQQNGFGIFGTSIAATWLDAQLGGKACYFVDEDAGRVGRQHLGRSILAPKDIPSGGHLFIPLPVALARQIAARIREQCSNQSIKIFLPGTPVQSI